MRLQARTALGVALAIGAGACSFYNPPPPPDLADGSADSSTTADSGGAHDAAGGTDAAEIDATTGNDSGAGADAGGDAGGPPPDAGSDAFADVGFDGGWDGGFDAALDGGYDSGYDAGPVSQSFTLKAGPDNFTGGPGNDQFTSTVAGGFTAVDALDGLDGIDTLTVTDPNDIAPGAATVRHIEIASLASWGTVTVDTTSWTGLTSLTTLSANGTTVTSGAATDISATATTLDSDAFTVNGGKGVTVVAEHSTSGAISVGGTTAPVGDISVSNTSRGAVAMGAISVTGGTSVSVTQAATNAVNTQTTMGAVTVTGSAATASVTIANSAAATAGAGTAGVATSQVTINDVNQGSSSLAGTITAASITNYTAATISDNALSTLHLSGGSGNVIISNGGLTNPTNTTLNLSLSGITGGTLSDSNIYGTLNVTTTGTSSVVANISDTALTALSLGGTKALTLTSTAGVTHLATVTITGSAGLIADLSGTPVTAVTAAGTSGDNTITINPSVATYTGGAGADVVRGSGGAISKAIDLGAGDDYFSLGSNQLPTAAVIGGTGIDTLSANASFAAGASGSGTFASFVTGFELLELTGATNQTVNLSALGGFAGVTTSGGNGLILNNLPSGGTLTLTGAGTAYILSNAAFLDAGVTEAVNIAMQESSGQSTTFGDVTAAHVQTINIASNDFSLAPGGTITHYVTVTDPQATTVSISGNAGLNLTCYSTALTNIDGSGMTAGATQGGLTFTSAALASASTILGSATGSNLLDFSASLAAVTYTGGSGSDNVTLTNGKNNVVHLGDGANTLTLAAGANTVTGGAGVDTVTLGGANGVTSIDLGAGIDSLTINGIPTAQGSLIRVTGLGAGESLSLSGTQGSATALSTQTSFPAMVTGQSDFVSYINACAAGDGHTHSAFSWFQLGGNTYIVHDTSTATTFVDGADTVIELTGNVDLSASSITSGHITI